VLAAASTCVGVSVIGTQRRWEAMALAGNRRYNFSRRFHKIGTRSQPHRHL